MPSTQENQVHRQYKNEPCFKIKTKTVDILLPKTSFGMFIFKASD